MYAKRGEISLGVVANGDQQGVVIVARDQGPGIPDVTRALQDGYSTSGGLGLGLPGARRLMDDFDVVSISGKGTTVRMKKWRRRDGWRRVSECASRARHGAAHPRVARAHRSGTA